ncbi:translation initiation factor IF3-1, mitochondrial [Gastrolobium bilobum]|uniref:translation initiation factor IF3-1, mitochondrial n=1 Tax=Gastrolobium bilobum TaxID=150636 RepID=UPI002AB13B3C|nr:translation initiation factor IF3-1, mitochondrial [Gastrolobium bilobum]
MAIWHRIGKSKLQLACTQFRRCYIHIPNASSLNSTPKPRHMEVPHPNSVFHGMPTSVCNSVRFFAAPVQFQVKPKKEEDLTNGPRLNDKIKAQYVRLVTDDGHTILSRFEALERARKLKLDLVEVQSTSNPPVCKIMDYDKEMYQRRMKEKERAKSKSKMTLRNECKEVRFSEKTELKDLKTKADMVKKLMEKGYRVKCRATGNENQDTTGLLDRLFALIEDVGVVESGPTMAKKDTYAYMIVRHVRFGAFKKGGKKSENAADTAVKGQEGNMEPLTANSSDSMEYENHSSAESGFETEEEVPFDGDKHISPSVSRTVSENRYRRADHPGENKVPYNAQMSPAVAENRYKRAEPRNRFQQTTLNNTGPYGNNNGPGIRDAPRSIPSNLNQMRHVPVDTNVNPRIENTKQSITPGSRNAMPSSHEDIPKHGLSHPSAPNTSRPGYGIFSVPKGPETQAGMHRNREGNSQ